MAERRSRGLTSAGGERTSRSVAEILRANILTRFNLILGVLLAVILVWGEPPDALFGIVLVTNALIGIGQELRAKRTLDRLTVLSAPRVRVIRDGAPREIAVGELVADDRVDLQAGDQLVADGVVRASASLQADESLLTGESEPVDKRAGDRLLSGSFVVAGAGGYQAAGVGAEAYARKLAAQARRFAVVRSELVAGNNQILRYVTWVIPPVAVLLVVSQLHTTGQTVREGATSTVAALVGMVPQGLVLLTSITFGGAAVTLARRRVLVQQLPAVEGLARVDVVCLDKTGTLTDGTIVFDSLIRLDDQAPAEAALGALAAEQARNATLAAIGQAFPPPPGWTRQHAVPFSSARKWSGASFNGHGTWVLGAPEMVLPASQDGQLSRAADLAASGRRVLALAYAPGPLDGQALPAGLRAAAFIMLAERLRPDATATIAYFAAQNVALKVSSGDSPRTVGTVAARAGVPKAGDPVDARDLPEDPGALGALLEERTCHDDARVDRQHLDTDQRHPDVGVNDQPLVQDGLDDVGQPRRRRPAASAAWLHGTHDGVPSSICLSVPPGRRLGCLGRCQVSITVGELVIRAVGELVVGELVIVIVIVADGAGAAPFSHADQLPLLGAGGRVTRFAPPYGCPDCSRERRQRRSGATAAMRRPRAFRRSYRHEARCSRRSWLSALW